MCKATKGGGGGPTTKQRALPTHVQRGEGGKLTRLCAPLAHLQEMEEGEDSTHRSACLMHVARR